MVQHYSKQQHHSNTTLHYVWERSDANCKLGVPYTFCGEENHVSFRSKNHPGTSHKLRSLWAGPYQVMKMIALALAEIKPVYYPGEEKLLSLDVLKLYRGEYVIWIDD